MGLFFVHMSELYSLYWAHPTTVPLQRTVHDVVFTMFGGKSFALLSLCFGASFFIIMDRQAQRGNDFTVRFLWRLAVLGLFGLLHSLWYWNDILEILALMGVLLLPIYRVKSNLAILALAVFLLLQPQMWIQLVSALAGAEWANRPPGYWSLGIPRAYLTGSLLETLRTNLVFGHLFKWQFMWESGRLNQILGLSLIGFLLGRIGSFQRPEGFVRTRLVCFAVAVIVALGLYLGRDHLAALVPQARSMVMPRVILRTILSSLLNLNLMLALMMGFLTLYYGRGHRILNALAPAGRMTLTLYVGQALVFVPVFYGFGLGLHATMTQTSVMPLAALAFAAQLVFAHMWFRHFRYGPLEWVWRAATFWTVDVPFRRRPA